MIRHIAVFLVVVFLLALIPIRHAFFSKTDEGQETAAENSAGNSQASDYKEQVIRESGSDEQKAGSNGQKAESGRQDTDEKTQPAGSNTEAAGPKSESASEKSSAIQSAASSEDEENTVKDSLQHTREEVVSKAEEIEEERNKPTEEELRKQERDSLSAMDLEDLAKYLREHDVPEDLVYFMEEYPESREFVTDYLYQPDTPPSKSIAGEVTKGRIPHFLQWDKRWGYEEYGGTFLAVSGCGPTALSEVYSGLTGKTDMNPYEMAKWAEEMGYHIPGSGTAWEMMTGGAWQLGLNAWALDGGVDSLLWALTSGYPVICAMAPGDFTYFGHFIVLVSADENDNIRLVDSNSRIRTQRLWTVDELMWQITGMWAYSYDG